MIRRSHDLACFAVPLALLAVIGLANWLGRVAWLGGMWPRRDRMPGGTDKSSTAP